MVFALVHRFAPAHSLKPSRAGWILRNDPSRARDRVFLQLNAALSRMRELFLYHPQGDRQSHWTYVRHAEKWP